MDAFEVLADPVRRRILELLGPGEMTAGGITEVIRSEFGISQPGVSQHLRTLRDSGLALVRTEGTRRYYRADVAALGESAAWFVRFADPFRQPLDALVTEVARGRKSDRQRSAPPVRPRSGHGRHRSAG